MVEKARTGRRKAAVVGAGVLLALLAGSLTPASAVPVPVNGVDQCPAAVPMNTVAAGMTGEGLTVVHGSTPEPFAVEVLGVLKDGIGAGRDMIMIKVSDVAGHHVIDQGGGIWAGMSGSPVYVDGKLLGSVSYGFTWAPSPIGGLTPAADMYDLLGLQNQAAHKAVSTPARLKASLPAATRKALAEKAGVAVPKGSLQQLVTPLAVSGLRPKRLERMQRDADTAGLAVKAYAAGRRDAPAAAAAPAGRPQAGGNFAAMLSYGDVTAGAIGTTTAVCGNQAVAFGHPFAISGPTTLGASDADALAIVKDDTLGSFKMANIGADFGTVDQDRFAGIRANLTKTPDTAELASSIRNLDTGKKRLGTTKVVDQNYLASLLLYSVWTNYDNAFDEWGDGVATSEWTIAGRRADNKPFSLSRTNRWAARDDVTIDPAFDVADAAYNLINNGFEKVTLDNVTFGSSVTTKFDQYHIRKVQVSVNGGAYKTVKRLTVKAGTKLKVRVSLSAFMSSKVAATTTISMTVPKSAKGQRGTLAVDGGSDLAGDDFTDSSCFLDGDECEDGDGLDAVIDSITSAPRNDAVVARLMVGDDEDEGTPTVSKTKLQSLTVSGGKEIAIRVKK